MYARDPSLIIISATGMFSTPAVGCPWAGKEIENPTQTRVWRGLLSGCSLRLLSAALHEGTCGNQSWWWCELFAT